MINNSTVYIKLPLSGIGQISGNVLAILRLNRNETIIINNIRWSFKSWVNQLVVEI